MSAPSSDSASRRYLALVARAKDQAGTPEGDTCQRMAESMLAARPDLADLTDSLPTEKRDYRFDDLWEHDLLVRIGQYLGLTAKRYVAGEKLDGLISDATPRTSMERGVKLDVIREAKRLSRLVMFVTDAPTHAAIEQTYAVLRQRMAEVMAYAFAGFQCGALPIVREPSTGESVEEPDLNLLGLARAAHSFGTSQQPRKAIR